MERFGVYVPGSVGGYFRDVCTWKEASCTHENTLHCHKIANQSQYAVGLIKQTRERGTQTPFLRTVLAGETDQYLSRPLNDSEIAEECMGGM